MNTVKVMSIIGIIIFSICFLGIVAFMPEASTAYTQLDIDNADAAMGGGLLATMYGLAYSITCLVQSKKIKSD